MLQKTRYKMGPAHATILLCISVTLCRLSDAKEFEDTRPKLRDDFISERFHDGIKAIVADPAVRTAATEALLKRHPVINEDVSNVRRLKEGEDSFDDVDGYGSDSEDMMKDTEEIKQKEEFVDDIHRRKTGEANAKVFNRSVEKITMEDRSKSEDVIKIVPKDGKFFAVDDSQPSDGENGRNSKIKGAGAPFFIADDGKSIKLPKSDVIYNTETGDIVIRNRNSDRSTIEDVLETKSSNVRPESAGPHDSSKVVSASDDDTKPKTPLVYTVPIIENVKSHPSGEERANVDSDVTRVSSFHKKTDVNNVMTGKINVISDEGKTDLEYTTLKDDGEIIEANMRTSEEVTINPFDIGKIISNEKARNGKKSMDRSEEEEIAPAKEAVEKADSVENKDTIKTSTETTQINEDEPVYKFPITTEKPKTVKETQRFEDGFNDSYKPEDAGKRIVSNPSLRGGNSDESSLSTASMSETDNREQGLMKKNTIDKNHEEDYEQRPENFIAMPAKTDSVLDKNAVKQNSSPVRDIFIPVKKEVKILNREEALVAVRGYLEDAYLRPPIAVVVDSEVSNLQSVGKTWEEMERRGGDLNVGDIVLLAYDQDGITWMSHHRSSGQQQGPEARSFKKALESIKPASKRLIGSDPAGPLTRAARLLPYDSAVFLFSDGSSPVPPPRLVKLFLSKRIKLYSISSSNIWAMEAADASGGASVSLNPKPLIQNPQQPQQNYQDQNGQSQKYNGQTFQSEVLDQTVQEKQRNQQIYHGANEQNLYHEHLDHGSQRDLRETSYERHHQRGLRALPATIEDNDEEEELDFDEEQTILLRSNLTGIQTLAIPIDSSIRSLIITVTKKPKLATLYGPRGIIVDLLESTTSSDDDLDGLIYRLPMAKDRTDEEETSQDSEPYQGIWKLTVKTNTSDAYDVRVKAETSVRVMAKLVRTTHGPPESKNLKIAVGGTVASVREAVLIDGSGAELGKLNYKYRYADSGESASDVTEVETLRAMESGTVVREAAIPEDIAVGTAFRVRITGRNDKDEPFVRLSKELIAPLNPKPETSAQSGRSAKLEDQTLGRGLGDIEAERGVNFNLTKQAQITTAEGLPMTALQIGSSSRLYGTPGAQMQINFEVTNNRENAVYFKFGAKDDQYFLRSMNPQRQWINGGQTANVVVSMGITSTAENGVRDTVIFTANGLDQTQISAHVYVETDGRISQDHSRPYLRHDFRGDCMGYLDSSTCNRKTWGLDITARDTESGLLRISTSPGVIIYDSNFRAGAREEVRAKYTATCCETRVVLSATDLNGNVASDEINVSLYFTPATIAAIVLGILLIIALIIALVFLIRFCLRKRRDSRDLPSYQTQRATRTP